MVSQDQERRKYKRIKHHFIVKFRPYQEGIPQDSDGWDVVTMKDLSEGGMCFNYSEKIALGTVLEFNIELPSVAEKIHCLGIVRRVDEPSNKANIRKIPVYGIAVSFKEIENDKKEAIKALVEKFHLK